MQTPTSDTMTIDDKIIEAVNALGQFQTDRLILVVVIFAIVAFIFYVRVGSKSKESEGKRDEENTKILLQFAGMVERADANRERAVDNRNSETAKAIEGMTNVLQAATETQRVSNVVLERASTTNELGAKYRKELLDKTTELKMATLDQTDQLRAMQIDFKEWPSATKTALELLIDTVADLNRNVGNPKEMREQLLTIKEIAETILEIAKNNAALIRSIAAPSALDKAPKDDSELGFRVKLDARRKTDQIKKAVDEKP